MLFVGNVFLFVAVVRRVTQDTRTRGVGDVVVKEVVAREAIM